MTYVWIALGGAIGSVGRFAVSSAFARALGGTFPWGTVAVNISGCFVIGVLAALTAPGGRAPATVELRQFLMIGVCGGYTTFSSFSLQTLDLVKIGDMVGAGANIVVSVVACLIAVWLGAAAAQAFNLPRAG